MLAVSLNGCSVAMRPPEPPSASDSLYALTKLQALLDDHFTSLLVTHP